MSYQWTKGCRFQADPDLVGAELKSLSQVSIDTVLNKAKDKASELNKCFTWENDVAAEKYRRHEASMLISSIEIVVEDTSDGEPDQVTINAYVSVKENGEKAKFEFTPHALKDKDYSDQILKSIEKDIDKLKEKMRIYKHLITPEIISKVKALVS